MRTLSVKATDLMNVTSVKEKSKHGLHKPTEGEIGQYDICKHGQ